MIAAKETPAVHLDVWTLENVELPPAQRAVVDVLLYELIHGLLTQEGLEYLQKLQREIDDEMRADAAVEEYNWDDYGC